MMEMDDPGEASGESGGSVESVGKDVQACDVRCDGFFVFVCFMSQTPIVLWWMLPYQERNLC